MLQRVGEEQRKQADGIQERLVRRVSNRFKSPEEELIKNFPHAELHLTPHQAAVQAQCRRPLLSELTVPALIPKIGNQKQ